MTVRGRCQRRNHRGGGGGWGPFLEIGISEKVVRIPLQKVKKIPTSAENWLDPSGKNGLAAPLLTARNAHSYPPPFSSVNMCNTICYINIITIILHFKKSYISYLKHSVLTLFYNCSMCRASRGQLALLMLAPHLLQQVQHGEILLLPPMARKCDEDKEEERAAPNHHRRRKVRMKMVVTRTGT